MSDDRRIIRPSTPSNGNVAQSPTPSGNHPFLHSRSSSFNTNDGADIDIKTVTKHLIAPEDALKHPGGDITRHLYHQVDGVLVGAEDLPPKRRTRSSSFSTYLAETRRGSTASEINVPGGFRREYIVNQSLQRNEEPPNFLTKNFMEFLSIYGHFAGEDFDDDAAESSDNELAVDEESSLLRSRDPHYGAVPKQLPSYKPASKGSASVAKTFFLVFKSLVGSGVLFLPRAFYNGGMMFLIVTLSMFGLLTFFCYFVLIQSKRILNLTSFGELGYKTYGQPLKVCILISIIISQIGFVATYILFTAENMMSFLSTYIDSPYLTTANVVMVQCVLLIPLVLIRNLTKLSLISLVSSVFILTGLLIIFYHCGVLLLEYGVGPNIVQFNSRSWSMLIGVAVTSFEGIGLILPIESSMAQPEKFPMVLSVSMVIITALFVAIGTVGYTAFGDHVKLIIILNLPQQRFEVQSILVLYSVAVFLTGPLQLFPAVRIGEGLIFHRGSKSSRKGKLYHSGKYNPQVKWLKNLFRSLSVVFICSIAYLNANNIDKFISFNGCFACIPLVYIYPPLIHLKLLENKSTLNDTDKWLRVCDWTLIGVGAVTVVYTTYQVLFMN